MLRRRGGGRRQTASNLPAWRTGLNWLSTQAYVSLGFLLVVLEKNNNLMDAGRVLLRAATFGLLG